MQNDTLNNIINNVINNIIHNVIKYFLFAQHIITYTHYK